MNRSLFGVGPQMPHHSGFPEIGLSPHVGGQRLRSHPGRKKLQLQHGIFCRVPFAGSTWVLKLAQQPHPSKHV